jgi:ketosteroid isomerase-like protein
MSSRFLLCLTLLVTLGVLAVGRDPLILPVRAEAAAMGCAEAQAVTPALRRELLEAREAVWRAWFANDQKKLAWMVPEETIAINAGEEEWQGRAAALAGAEEFARSGGRLVRLEFPRTKIALYGDVAVLFSLYSFETESGGERSTSAGRATEIFVRRNGRWVNPGWHTDSGK